MSMSRTHRLHVVSDFCRSVRRLLLLVVACVFCAASSLHAQNTGSVSGNVVDQASHVIPGASVTLSDESQGRHFAGRSNSKGEYLIDDVPIGEYQLKVTAPSFSTVVINGIVVNANNNVRHDAHMANGEVAVEVNVSSDGTTLDTRSPTIGTTLDSQLVESLPIDGENIVSLASLLPGVTNVNAPTTFTSDNGGPTYSVSGSRGNSNLFLFDGQVWNNVFYNTGLNYPPRLALAEVSVLLNNYKAQYGRNSGSIFNTLTKSGTNSVHGTVFEYYQNSYFNAADYITGLNPHMISNQFGATVGGPIRKERAYFFLSYGGLRMVDGYTARATPPTLRELGFDAPGVPHICGPNSVTPGKQCADFYEDFSQTGTAYGQKFVRNPIYTGGATAANSLQTSYNIANGLDPNQKTIASPCVTDLTAYMNANASSSTKAQYLPSTEYPTECFDQTAMNFITKYLPIGNSVSATTATSAPQPRVNNEGLARVDLNLGAHAVDARFYVTNVNDITSNSVSAGVGIPGASRDLNVAGLYAGNIGDRFALNANMLNVARAAYKRYTYIILPTDRTTLGDLGAVYTQPGPNFLPSVDVTNRFIIGNSNSSDSTTVTANEELDDDFSWQHGVHSFQFGAQFLNLNYLHRFYTEPRFTSELQNTGVAMGDFLSGLLYTATVGNLTNLAARQYALYSYAQDDWRILPRVTLNLGVRWELPFSWKESDHQGTAFLPGYQSLVYPTAPSSIAYEGDPGVPNTAPATRYHQLAPRVGFAYDVMGNGRLVFRGGYGIFFDSLNANLVGVGQPFHYSAFYSTPAGGLSMPLQGLPAIPADYYKGQPAQFVLPYTINYVDRHISNPYSEAVNFGFQLQMAKSARVEMNYVGKFGRHQIIALDNNPAIYDCSGSYYQANPSVYCPGDSKTATSAAGYQSRVKYPGFNYGGQGIVDNQSIASSNYNGFQVIYSQKAVWGITVYSSYTLSRSIDLNSNGATNAARVPQPNHLYLERAASDFNATHIFNMGWTWKFPRARFKSAFANGLVNNWSFGGIFNARTGNPINITIAGDASWTNERTQRPVLVPGVNPRLPDNRHRSCATNADPTQECKVQAWFNPLAFATPTGGTFSDLRRNFLVGPAYLNTNMNVQRQFRFLAHDSVELRLDAFNVWNTPNLANPNSSLAASTSNQAVNIFGQIPATVGTNNSIGSNGRRLQFGFILRY